MSDGPDIAEIEASGETLGEAKWQALRELERLYPGLDRNAVSFEVLAEGERGLLGVGTSPARVLARAELAATEPAGDDAQAGSSLEGTVHALASRIAGELGIRGQIEVTEDDAAVHASFSGPEIGILIGRNGRTIDAVQHVVSSIAHRIQGPGGKRVEVDAGGYRARRRVRVESEARRAADRVRATGSPVALESMSAIERKLVHTALQDVDEVETQSEGDEPNRYVVVRPVVTSRIE